MKPYFEADSGIIYQGHVLDVLRDMDSEFVQLCAFSPPYWGLRKYSVKSLIWDGDSECRHEWNKFDRPGMSGGPSDKQEPNKGSWHKTHIQGQCQLCGAWRGDLGLEPTPELYLDHMMLVMAEVWRVLRDDGVCFVNLGDSYSGSGKAGSNPEYQERHTEFGKPSVHKERFGLSGIKPQGNPAKSLCLIPQKFAIRCQEAGWIIRSEIIWAKPNPMPESVKDRPTRSHEQVWMMVKEQKYYWDQDAVREAVDPASLEREKYTWKRAFVGRHTMPGEKRPHSDTHQHFTNPDGRNIRDVWHIATEPMPEAHFATWPMKLCEKMIRAGSKPSDIVLDPFFGSGTVGVVCKRLNRKWIGVELSKEYCKIAARRIDSVKFGIEQVQKGKSQEGLLY